jgi:hypothetical protein
MKDYLIICRSITYAQRAARAVQRAGVSAQLLRIPAGLVKSGCGYALRVRGQDIQRALRAMERENMRPAALFGNSGGGYREVRP